MLSLKKHSPPDVFGISRRLKFFKIHLSCCRASSTQKFSLPWRKSWNFAKNRILPTMSESATFILCDSAYCTPVFHIHAIAARVLLLFYDILSLWRTVLLIPFYHLSCYYCCQFQMVRRVFFMHNKSHSFVSPPLLLFSDKLFVRERFQRTECRQFCINL